MASPKPTVGNPDRAATRPELRLALHLPQNCGILRIIVTAFHAFHINPLLLLCLATGARQSYTPDHARSAWNS